MDLLVVSGLEADVYRVGALVPFLPEGGEESYNNSGNGTGTFNGGAGNDSVVNPVNPDSSTGTFNQDPLP